MATAVLRLLFCMCESNFICWLVTDVITAYADFDALLLFVFKMHQSLENPTSCEICTIIRILNARDVKVPKIHQHISEIYREIAMITKMERKWATPVKYRHTNVHKGEVANHSS